MFKILLAFVAALVVGIAAIGYAAAEPPDAAKIVSPDTYPAGLQQVLQRATADCKASGGSGLTFPPDAVRAFDLTGDGRDDYIVATTRPSATTARPSIAAAAAASLMFW